MWYIFIYNESIILKLEKNEFLMNFQKLNGAKFN